MPKMPQQIRRCHSKSKEQRLLRKRLRNEEQLARYEYDKAILDFQEIIADVPSGLPHPDGTDRVRNARKLVQSATESYGKAHKRLTDFLLHGFVPESSDENR